MAPAGDQGRQPDRPVLRGGHVDRLADLVTVLKALASPPRLALFGCLAARPSLTRSLADMAAGTGLPAAIVARELPILAAAGIIHLEPPDDAGGDTTLARVDERLVSRLQAAIGPVTTVIDAVRPPAPLDERQLTLARYFRDGQLVTWPAQPRRFQVVLEAVADQIPAGQRLPEAEINVILKRIYPADHVTLRRALVDAGLLQRASGLYWRPGTVTDQPRA
jgi:hypothetical protein